MTNGIIRPVFEDVSSRVVRQNVFRFGRVPMWMVERLVLARVMELASARCRDMLIGVNAVVAGASVAIRDGTAEGGLPWPNH